jgi:two-component system nitrate/nitrite response regulator NarL
MFRDLLHRTLRVIAGFNVVGIAADGFEALQRTRELKPQVLILDISMPYKDGIEVLKAIRTDDSATVVIMFTSDPSPDLHKICLEAGANYFLGKTQITELIEILNIEMLAG